MLVLWCGWRWVVAGGVENIMTISPKEPFMQSEAFLHFHIIQTYRKNNWAILFAAPDSTHVCVGDLDVHVAHSSFVKTCMRRRRLSAEIKQWRARQTNDGYESV